MVRAKRWVISVSVLPLVTYQPLMEPLWGRADGGWWRMRSGARGDLYHLMSGRTLDKENGSNLLPEIGARRNGAAAFPETGVFAPPSTFYDNE